jgi:hypothetical protein
VLLVSSGPAAAQDGGRLDPEDLETIGQFVTEISKELQVGIAEVPEIIGEPGERDRPPGVMEYLGEDATEFSAELPGGTSSVLTGPCQGIAASFAPDGDGYKILDIAADFDDAGPPLDLYEPLDDGRFAQAFTSGNPFEVHVDGFVVYAGYADPAPIEHNWEIRTYGLSLDSGGDPNGGAENRNAGTVNLKEDLPAAAKVNALFYIEGEMTANSGFRCDGSGYFKTTGGNRTLEGAGVVLVLAMGFGALFNSRPARTWRA